MAGGRWQVAGGRRQASDARRNACQRRVECTCSPGPLVGRSVGTLRQERKLLLQQLRACRVDDDLVVGIAVGSIGCAWPGLNTAVGLDYLTTDNLYHTANRHLV